MKINFGIYCIEFCFLHGLHQVPTVAAFQQPDLIQTWSKYCIWAITSALLVEGEGKACFWKAWKAEFMLQETFCLLFSLKLVSAYLNYCTNHLQLQTEVLSQHKPACTRGRWHSTTVRTCAWLWPKAQRSCFVAFFSSCVQGFCFWKIFCILTFLKLLYFLPSHCQLSLAVSVEFNMGVCRVRLKVEFYWFA